MLQEEETDLVSLELGQALAAEAAKEEELETQEDILHLKVFQMHTELETDLNHKLMEVMVTIKMDKGNGQSPGPPGDTNTGGGGGAGGQAGAGMTQPGGSGGSGVVIVRYKFQ